MPRPASDPAYRAISEWWSDMGVAADETLTRPLLQNAVPAQTQQKAPEPAAPKTRKSAPPPRRKAGARSPEEWVEAAKEAAAACDTIETLADAIAAFEGCPLKQGCERTVVFDGVIGAPVMVIGEGPGADEDRLGKPFVGRAGQLLDKMLAAIDLSRETNAFITNVNYWRPPQNRNPDAEELAVCRPFVDRMIMLAQPKLIIAAGNVPTKSLLGISTGIMKTRGTEHAYAPPADLLSGAGIGPIPFFPIFHPAFLLRRPIEKSRAWRDLLNIEKRLAELS